MLEDMHSALFMVYAPYIYENLQRSLIRCGKITEIEWTKRTRRCVRIMTIVFAHQRRREREMLSIRCAIVDTIVYEHGGETEISRHRHVKEKPCSASETSWIMMYVRVESICQRVSLSVCRSKVLKTGARRGS
jgi:hypothetical protein